VVINIMQYAYLGCDVWMKYACFQEACFWIVPMSYKLAQGTF